jgi:hypothetical protein
MNPESEPKHDSFRASQYILENFEPTDRIAILVRNQRSGEVLQRITTATNAAGSDFQTWLRYKNLHGADIYIGMNSLKRNAKSRTKEDIATIRHLYLDIDHRGPEVLDAVRHSSLVPPPNYILESSPHKFQVTWKVKGITQEESEWLQRAMVREFGADPAATDSTRVLRLPGFTNHKYEHEFVVNAHAEAAQTYSLDDFKIPKDLLEEQLDYTDVHEPRSLRVPGKRSQSERDWAYALRALARGDHPEEVIRRVADYRAEEKQNPEYYARHTVQKARAALEQRKTGTQTQSPEGPSAGDGGADHDRTTIP